MKGAARSRPPLVLGLVSERGYVITAATFRRLPSNPAAGENTTNQGDCRPSAEIKF